MCGCRIKFNQRFQLLNPDDEKYTARIENAIYNALLRTMVPRPKAGGADARTPAGGERWEQMAHGKGDDAQKEGWLAAQLVADADPALPPGIRYHSSMEGVLEHANNVNTCCEGQVPFHCLSLTFPLPFHCLSLTFRCPVLLGHQDVRLSSRVHLLHLSEPVRSRFQRQLRLLRQPLHGVCFHFQRVDRPTVEPGCRAGTACHDGAGGEIRATNELQAGLSCRRWVLHG